MGQRLGNGYIGTSSVKTSVANEEIIPARPNNWSKGYSLYKFEFANDQDCTIKINGGSPIFLREQQGFSMNEVDAPIYSFIIVESGITYNFIGTY